MMMIDEDHIIIIVIVFVIIIIVEGLNPVVISKVGNSGAVTTATIPYIRGTSETIPRILQPCNIVLHSNR